MRRSDREIKDYNEILDILQRGSVCHLALSDNNIPYIIALNYGWTKKGDLLTLYFHCARSGKKLDIIKKNNLCCFMIDIDHKLYKNNDISEWTMKYRSIIGMGKIEIITEDIEKKHGMDTLMRHYSNRNEFEYKPSQFSAVRVLKLSVSEIFGKKNI